MNYAVNWWKGFAQTHENVKHSIAGAGAGMISSIVTCPLDVVKTRLQNQIRFMPYRGTLGTLRAIGAEEGIRGLYRGLGPTILGYLPTWAIYFTVYDYCKMKYTHRNNIDRRGHNDWLLHIASATSAGLVSSTVMNPVWVIKTRFMSQPKNSPNRYINTMDAFITIAREEGVRGFYKGIVPSLFGVTHVAIQFPLYEKLKYMLCTDLASGTTSILLASSISKMVASTITYPHEVIRTRLQNQVVRPYKYKGVFHALMVIRREEGIRGFYKGISTNLLRTVPASAVTIFTYETIVTRFNGSI